jgi:hypothetical protein
MIGIRHFFSILKSFDSLRTANSLMEGIISPERFPPNGKFTHGGNHQPREIPSELQIHSWRESSAPRDSLRTANSLMEGIISPERFPPNCKFTHRGNQMPRKIPSEPQIPSLRESNRLSD